MGGEPRVRHTKETSLSTQLLGRVPKPSRARLLLPTANEEGAALIKECPSVFGACLAWKSTVDFTTNAVA